ncbi:MAG: hypothetical protein O6909_00470, partial [Alphaproteobacteria bacterium]|nr:hypothetical protein [Alphaproteobacteria bacterium]
LAGAAELDGRNGARVAAEAAARTGLSGTLLNVQAFATDGGGPGIAIDPGPLGVVFLRNLPADGTDFTAADTATSDADARFIFVSVVNRNIRSGLSRALGVIPDFDTDARSIAGFHSVVCRIPAMMMCNPLEDLFYAQTVIGCNINDGHYGPPSGGLQARWVEHKGCLRGKQVLMKTAGGGAAYNPGEFGLLDPPTGNQGAAAIAEMIATSVPDFCISDTADLRTGQAMGPVVSALNVRFDIYEPPMFGGNSKNNPDYRPALNVVKGYTFGAGNGCNNGAPPDPMPPIPDALSYPRDACFLTDSCWMGRFGTGDWYQETYDHDPLPTGPGPGTADVEPYWAVNHPPGDVSQPSAAQGDAKDYIDMTRYEVYRYEIEQLGAPPPGITDNTALIPIGEQGNPSCYTGGEFSDPINDDPNDPDDDDEVINLDRRLLRMVVINCVAEGPLNGNEDDVPTIGTVEMFLTEPAQGQGNDKADIYGEISRIAPPGQKDGVRDIVQLYR